MKKVKVLFLFAIAMTISIAGAVGVSASPTDLSSLTIYGVDAAGTKTEVPVDFSSTVYSYDITVKSNVEKLELEYTPEDSTSTAEIVNEAYNTKMDTGEGNKTQVKVTASDGTSALYTINTKKLTPEEDATYDETAAAKPKGKEVSVKVGKRTLKVSKTIPSEIPKGFEKSTYKYKGKKYECIVKGDAEKLVALYLHNSKVQGFYVYNEDADTFYELKNVEIASRMYTIVNVDDTAKILKNYEKKSIDIGNVKAKVWALNEDEDLYLVYAMNWDEEVNLYCYDAREHDFQRYPVSEDTYSQKEAAEVAYTNLQTNRNQLAKKYNMLLKIIGGLTILIAESDEDENQTSDKKLTKEEKKAEKLRKKEEKKKAKKQKDKDELLEDELLEDLPNAADQFEFEEEEQTEKEQPADAEEEIPEETAAQEQNRVSETVEEPENSKDHAADSKPGEESEPEQENKEENSANVQKETEEDLRETLKAMLPEEDDDDDDDDDFEFIELD